MIRNRPSSPVRLLPFPSGRLHVRDWNATRRAWTRMWSALWL